MALREKFVPKERVELHKAEFRVRHHDQDEKLPDLASSLRRLVSRAYPEAVPDLQESLAKDQFIDALEDREMRMKLRESGLKTLVAKVGRFESYRRMRARTANSWSSSNRIQLL